MITGTTGVLLPSPVLSPAFLASSRNSLERCCSTPTRSGSDSSTRNDAKAAAAFGGDRPTLYTNPGDVYFKYSINSLVPAM